MLICISDIREPVCGNTTIVCDAWPVLRQIYGYKYVGNSIVRNCKF